MADEENEITPKRLRQIRIRRLFRALVRKVIANLYWLNAELHIKTKQINLKQARKGRFLLTTDERRILKTTPEYRTAEEIDLLCKTIGHFKCFRKYPLDVKRVLIAHTYYEYFPPGRVIVRQNAPPLAMYFIIAGQLEILTTKYIEELDEYTVISRNFFSSGDLFGDSALLHDTPRMATVTTVTHSELLVLYKFHFDTILRSHALKGWQEVRDAIEEIPFFERSTNYFKTEMCVMSHIAHFRRNEIILGDGIGKKLMVHFILKGKCTLIEHIPIKRVAFGTRQQNKYMTLEDEDGLSKWRKRRESTLKIQPSSNFLRISSGRSITWPSRSKNSELSKMLDGITAKSMMHLKDSSTEQDIQKSDNYLYPPNVDIHFIEICTYNPGSVFGLGENFNRRRIVASTNVTCLLVPSYWLLPQSNDWNMIKEALDKIIPDSDEVYKLYLKDQKFKKFKADYIKNLVRSHRACNTIHNVPYSIRIKEDFAFR